MSRVNRKADEVMRSAIQTQTTMPTMLTTRPESPQPLGGAKSSLKNEVRRQVESETQEERQDREDQLP